MTSNKRTTMIITMMISSLPTMTTTTMMN